MAKRGPKGPSKYTKKFLEKLADKLETWTKSKRNFWLGEFAAENDINRQELSRLAKLNEKLSDTLKKAKQVQENRFVKMGVSRKYNPAFIIFTLKNVAGWRDKIEHALKGKITVDNIKNATNEQLAKIIREGLAAFSSKRVGKKRTRKKKTQ